MTRNTHESGRIATGYVIRKLGERHYKAEKMGAVLHVTSPNGHCFSVKVASLSRPNAWIVTDQESPDTYYVLVFKPEGKLPEYFVLSQGEMMEEKQKHQRSMRYPLDQYSNPDLERMGLTFSQPERYRDKWDTLPR